MANHVSHGWPLALFGGPIKNTRFTLLVPYLDADGDPTDPTTPDTEISKDGGSFADCAEEVSTITGSNGMGYLTLSGAETDATLIALAAKVASGPKATLAAFVPLTLPVVESGTAQAGAASTITLASGAAAFDLSGCVVKTTGGTGGGGTGGANNQARLITAYNRSTKVATVSPSWETNPSSDTTYEILLTPLQMPRSLADVLLGRDMSDVLGEAARSPLNALRFLRNKWSLSGSTLTVCKEDDSTSAWTATKTSDVTAEPITGLDPA